MSDSRQSLEGRVANIEGTVNQSYKRLTQLYYPQR